MGVSFVVVAAASSTSRIAERVSAAGTSPSGGSHPLIVRIAVEDEPCTRRQRAVLVHELREPRKDGVSVPLVGSDVVVAPWGVAPLYPARFADELLRVGERQQRRPDVVAVRRARDLSRNDVRASHDEFFGCSCASASGMRPPRGS